LEVPWITGGTNPVTIQPTLPGETYSEKPVGFCQLDGTFKIGTACWNRTNPDAFGELLAYPWNMRLRQKFIVDAQIGQ